jgi:hypothetical protein
LGRGCCSHHPLHLFLAGLGTWYVDAVPGIDVFGTDPSPLEFELARPFDKTLILDLIVPVLEFQYEFLFLQATQCIFGCIQWSGPSRPDRKNDVQSPSFLYGIPLFDLKRFRDISLQYRVGADALAGAGAIPSSRNLSSE